MPIAGKEATTVFLGPARTPNPASQWAHAVATLEGEIVFVGTESDLHARGLVGASTKVIQLSDDQIVIPGFQDGHVHPLAAGIRETRCSLESASSLEDAMSIIQAYMEHNPELEWVTGSGWHWKWFTDELDGKPHALLLDQVTKGKPAVFRSSDGHNAWCNTSALQRAGLHEVTGATHHCEVHIERHPDTRFPTGLFHDEAMPLLYNLLPPLPLSQKMKGLALAIKKLYSHGITSFQDAMVRKANLNVYLASYGISPNKDLEADVARLGTLPRASLCLLWELESGFEKEAAHKQIEYFIHTREMVAKAGKSDTIRAGTVKVMLDGTLESQTAYLHAPYLHSPTPGAVGSALYTKDELCYMFTELDKNDFQIHVHAIGDATATLALDAFECCRKANPNGINNRHHIAHLQLVEPSDIGRFAQLNVVANFQPFWFLVDEDKYKVRDYIGDERYEFQYPIHSVIETGAKIAFGSDYPFGSLDPIAGLHTAVNHFHPSASVKTKPHSLPTSTASHKRKHNPHNDHNIDHHYDTQPTNDAKEKENEKEEESCRGFEVFRPCQKINIEQAVQFYTTGAAYVNYSEGISGCIEEGKKADLIVLSRNIFDMNQEEICDTTVKLTMANGSIVYNTL